MTSRRLWLLWILLMCIASTFLAYAVFEQDTSAKQVLLPGTTTHGHYQIELACSACHTKYMGVKQDACLQCHQEELKIAKDTHPESKFRDPTNAGRLEVLDAQKCITCHREHVPDRTHAMGLSLPTDYCYHCHQDIGEQRPSHLGMSHDSCAAAGCHNYHDNRALYENFLFSNDGQPDILDSPHVQSRDSSRKWIAKFVQERQPLIATDADGPTDLLLKPIVADWVKTAHALAGVNCRDCHEETSGDGRIREWKNKCGDAACATCHAFESEGFQQGRHGMRLAVGMTPMTPGKARLPMRESAAHQKLTCSACHQPHQYNTRFAAVDACISCHDDDHTNAYLQSSHYQLWLSETKHDSDQPPGDAILGTGVSCATCHMPRIEIDGEIRVQHNQNDNLRPNEKMIRSVCMNCHGLQFSLNALADRDLIDDCFYGQPAAFVESLEMARSWFDERARKKNKRKEQR